MWLRSLVLIGAALAAGLALALAVDAEAAALWLGVAMVALGLYHAVHLARLEHWLSLPRKRAIPVGAGLWGPVMDAIARFARAETETRQELDAELGRIHAAVDRLPDALVVLDRFGHVVWANRAAERLHGIWGTQRPIHHFVRQPEFLAHLESGRPGEPLHVSLAGHPGRTFEVRIVAAADAQRLMITRDVSEQMRLDAMRRDFVANVSHEIRTPLTVVSGFVETMIDLPLDEATRRDYLKTILQQTVTMRQLVEDLLALATLEHGMQPAGDEDMDLHATLSQLLDEARALSAGRHAFALRLDGPPRVRAVPAQMQSAIRNLLTNAVRYTPSGGHIDVHWFVRDGRGCIAVRDDGIGIAAEHIPRLTERFYRVDRGRSRETGGTGLGLAIAKHVLQNHRAQLLVDSTPGRGSVFTIALPGDRLVREPARTTTDAA